jgi:hypothetical protein
VLLSRNRHYRLVKVSEMADHDRDGIPDAYQDNPETRP